MYFKKSHENLKLWHTPVTTNPFSDYKKVDMKTFKFDIIANKKGDYNILLFEEKHNQKKSKLVNYYQ